MNISGQRKILAAVAVAILLTSMAGTAIVTERDDNEVEAAFGIDDIIIIGVLTLLISTSVYAGYTIGHSSGSGSSDEVLRGYEAQAVADSIFNNIGYYSNATANYNQIWKLTNEHHIRQAELAASEAWESGASFDADRILSLSAVYLNSAYMMDNAASQINEMWELVSESLASWNDTETYKDAMELELSWEGGSMSTRSSFGLYLGVAAQSVQSGHDRVYLTSSSQLWCSGPAVIYADSGKTYTLVSGMNDLSQISGFSEGIYTLQAGVSYCGDLIPVIDAEAAPVYAGAVMTCGTESQLAVYNDGVVVGGTKGTYLKIAIHPDGAESQTEDITDMMADFSTLLDTIYSTMSIAASAGASVWQIFDSAGEASAYLTTLAVPNVYEGQELTQAQQTMITILALEQLASYWQDNSGELKTDDYMMSDSMSLFCRGDIVSVTGETLYEDVIYTPFFYQDTSLKVGSNTVTRQAILAVWTTDGENLSGWDGITNASKAMLVTVQNGYSLPISEMRNEGTSVNSVDLTVSKISIIDPSELRHTQHEKDGRSWALIVMIVMAVIGAIIVYGGWRMDSYAAMAVGALIIIAGVLCSGNIASYIEGWLR